MRRTNASLIYRRTKNTRAVQILLGHTKLESTESPMVSWTYPTDCLWAVFSPSQQTAIGLSVVTATTIGQVECNFPLSKNPIFPALHWDSLIKEGPRGH
ncbi:hypothetical protein PS928_06638 [Pseudomonas fluorescens]|uniref:Uncharacterized protein n=1 Tax=Pseudomonas fluorescens TaxID=294 RepID=A0A5E7VV46_PSEFL|nr:hypothetical protein PS928_06638 [Pseudomonas fluorescens]